MAVPKISAKAIGLYFNEGTPEAPEWLMFACSTSDGLSGSTDTVTAATKCDGDWVDSLPTDLSWEFSNSSYAAKTAELSAGMASHDKAFELWSTKAEGMFMLSDNVDPAAADYLRIGMGVITSYSETSDSSDFLQFELTVTGKGAIANIPEA